MSSKHRGPGFVWAWHKDEKARELYEKGKDCERIAYAMGISVGKVREYLGKAYDEEREEKARKRIARTAWKRIVEDGEGFYSVRDAIKVNTNFLIRVLQQEFAERGMDDRSHEFCETDEAPYAAMVYRESGKEIYDVMAALEVKEQKAKAILGDEYDPYAAWRPEDTSAVEAKVRELYAKGMSFSQINWLLRNDGVDSESIIDPKEPPPWEAALQEELEERIAAGETIEAIAEDVGIAPGSLMWRLSGQFEHGLDLYGMGREKRAEVGRLYLDGGYEPDEIAVLTGFATAQVKECIDDFYYRYSDSDRHDESSERRWADPNARKIVAVAVETAPEEEERKRREKSRQTAERLGIDEHEAAKFFDGGLLPSRAEIRKEKDAREGIARAMFVQGKSIAEICLATGVAENTVKRYIAKELAAIEEENSSARSKVSREEEVAARYAARVTPASMAALPGDGGHAFLMPRAWTAFPSHWIYARQSEARRLMAFDGFSLADVAGVMGTSPATIKRTLGDFGADSTSKKELRQHALAAFLYDCLSMDCERIAELLGFESGYKVAAMLNDHREQPQNPSWYRGWWPNRIEPAKLSKLCGVDEKLLERAENLGLMGGTEVYRGFRADTADALRLLGWLDPHPFPLIEDTEVTENA